MRIRQLVLVAENLEKTTDQLLQVFGLRVCHQDPGVAAFGLVNVLLPVGDTFLEVVSPTQDGTTAGRLLEKRRGDGGYMVILQVDSFERADARIEAQGLRKVWRSSQPGVVEAAHIHPGDLGNTCILSLDEMAVPADWIWAGDDWRDYRQEHLVSTLLGVELAAEDPEAAAKIWAELLERQANRDGDGWHIGLDEGTWIRFIAPPERGPGLIAMAVKCSQSAVVLQRANELNLPVLASSLELGGVRFDLID